METYCFILILVIATKCFIIIIIGSTSLSLKSLQHLCSMFSILAGKSRFCSCLIIVTNPKQSLQEMQLDTGFGTAKVNLI